MESLLRFKCFQIRQVNGEYRLDQLVSWRNLANFFYPPLILGFGGPMVILDQARVQALNADGTIRVVTETPRDMNFWELFWPVLAVMSVFGLRPLQSSLMSGRILDSYAGYAALGIAVIVLLGFILLVNLQKASEVRRLKSLGLWGTVVPDNKATRAERQTAYYERNTHRLGLSQKAGVWIFIIVEVSLDLIKIGMIWILLSMPLTLGEVLLFSVGLLLLILLPFIAQGYPGKSLYMRDFPRA